MNLKLYFFIVFLFLIAHSSFSQPKGQFYLIRPKTNLHYIVTVKDTVPVSKTIMREVMSGGKVDTAMITETQLVPRVTKKSVLKYAPGSKRTLFRWTRYYKADLAQNKEGDSIRIRFWGFKDKNGQSGQEQERTAQYQEDSSQIKSRNAIPMSRTDSDNFYYVFSKPREDLTSTHNKYKRFYYKRSEFGVATMPFKMRFGYSRDSSGVEKVVPNDVSTAVNVGVYYGFKFGETLFYNDAKRTQDRWGGMLSVFTGPTVIKVQKTNVIETVLRDSNEPGWQIGAGGWLTRGKIEVGVFLGTDLALSAAAQKWDHAGKLWLGFGLGYKLGILDMKTE